MQTNYLNEREPGAMFSQAEFIAIPRNNDGDILDLYDAFAFITDAQREQLTGDDQSRCFEYDEELEYLAAEFAE
jgi:hypothetical protein